MLPVKRFICYFVKLIIYYLPQDSISLCHDKLFWFSLTVFFLFVPAFRFHCSEIYLIFSNNQFFNRLLSQLFASDSLQIPLIGSNELQSLIEVHYLPNTKENCFQTLFRLSCTRFTFSWRKLGKLGFRATPGWKFRQPPDYIFVPIGVSLGGLPESRGLAGIWRRNSEKRSFGPWGAFRPVVQAMSYLTAGTSRMSHSTEV